MIRVVEFRKLIKFGDSSFVVSLPKDWITKHNLVKGDTIYVDENENGLVLKPKEIKTRKEPKSMVIDADNKSLEAVQTEIVSSYLTNTDTIEVKGSSLRENAPQVKQYLHNLAGLEIIEQTKDKIVAKDLLNINEISIDSMVRRMDNIIRSMLDDSIASAEEDHFDSINQRDNDVNRLSFLTHRVIRLALRDHGVAKTLEVNHLSLLVDWQIVTYLEKIGDQSKRIARAMREARAKKKSFSKSTCRELKQIYKNLQQVYLKVMKSYYTKDKKLAYQIETESQQRISLCDSFEKRCRDPCLVQVIYNLKGMSTSIKNIARDVISIENEQG
ncbi:AbrB/MazE/SpoVT family DNA-binding domain-containing protein [Candidatus Woesearchaeota archaeon]|nr:AbrB/MazE/SpoVT family DNA-binding domain-containing protein [Candidatus Woesearchaeota archaeon]